jgi:hypothetical protein
MGNQSSRHPNAWFAGSADPKCPLLHQRQRRGELDDRRFAADGLRAVFGRRAGTRVERQRRGHSQSSAARLRDLARYHRRCGWSDPVQNQSTGEAEKEVGAWEGTKGLFVAHAPAPVRDVGAANSTIAAADRGWIVSHNTTAAVRTSGLPAAASLGEGFYVGVYADGALPVILQSTGGEAIHDSIVPSGSLVWLRSAGSKWLMQRTGASQGSTARQSVWMASRDADGFPNILPASSGGLALTGQNVSAANPLLLSAANGALNRNGYKLSLPAWQALTDNARNYLYAVINADGTITEASTTLVPVYQHGGIPGTANGQFTFNVGEMRGYLGNGSTAPQAYVVFIGEAVTFGGSVSSAVAYAYGGRYESPWTATLPSAVSVTSRSHNLGVPPDQQVRRFMMECTSTDQGYAVGDGLSGDAVSDSNTSVLYPLSLSGTSTAMSLVVLNTPFNVAHKTPASGLATLTAAKWKWRMTAERRW